MRTLAGAERRDDPRSRLRSPAGAVLGVAIAAAITALFTTFAEARALPLIEDRSNTPAVLTAPAVLTVPASIAPAVSAAPLTRDIGVESLERALRALAAAENAPRDIAAPTVAAPEPSPVSAQPPVLAASAPPPPVAAPATATPGTTFASAAPPAPLPATAEATAAAPAAALPAPLPATTVEAAAPTPAEPRFELTVRERGLLDAMNREREAAGVPLLRLDVTLLDIARERSQDMVDNSYFAHFAPDGESAFSLVGASGRRFSAIGENLARVRGDEGESVRFAITNLMASASHRGNILKERFTLVGVGAVVNAFGQTVFTTVFAAE